MLKVNGEDHKLEDIQWKRAAPMEKIGDKKTVKRKKWKGFCISGSAAGGRRQSRRWFWWVLAREGDTGHFCQKKKYEILM